MSATHQPGFTALRTAERKANLTPSGIQCAPTVAVAGIPDRNASRVGGAATVAFEGLRTRRPPMPPASAARNQLRMRSRGRGLKELHFLRHQQWAKL
jgi:hypothetical protein